MTRRISSRLTGVSHYLTLVLYLPIIAFLVITYDMASVTWWLIVSTFVVANVVGLLLFPFPKHVDLDADSIRVTSPVRGQVISVPLADILEVRPAWFTQHVSIVFRVETRFGRKITFIPRMKLFHPFLGHPDIQHLKDMVGKARSAVDN